MSSALRLGPVEVSAGFLAGMAALLCWCDLAVLAAFFAAAAAHELGHLLVARCTGMHFSTLRLTLTGAELTADSPVSRGREAAVLAAGPCASGMFALACAQLDLPMAAGASLILGGLNLLPVGPLDGGELLRLALSRWWWGERAARGLSLLFALALCVPGAELLSHSGNGGLLLFALWLVFWNGREIILAILVDFS